MLRAKKSCAARAVPAEAANVMKVNESDILDAIKDGTLKAKKVGKQFRVTKESLEAFMNS